MNLLQRGLAEAFRGLRTGNANLVAWGAALLFFAWLRSSKPGRTLVHKEKLGPGDGITVRFSPPGAAG